MRGGGGGVERAVAAELAGNAMRAHEVANVVHGGLAGTHQAQRLGLAEQSFEGQKLGRPGQQAAAVAPAGAGAAQVALQDDDVQLRLALFGLYRRPQAGEAAADDANIGGLLALQGGGQVAIAHQGLLNPEGTHAGILAVDSYFDSCLRLLVKR